MDPASVTLRRARPDELDLLVEIDDDASRLYAEFGLPLALGPDHPFVVAEQARWESALALGRVVLAVDEGDRGLGFVALGTLGDPGSRKGADPNEPYLDQLSVRRRVMGQGIGRRLLRRAIAWTAEREGERAEGQSRWLWLTTYRHLRWNRPFYETEGFAVAPEEEWPAAISRHVAEQRRHLPDPEQRIAMRRPLGDGRTDAPRWSPSSAGRSARA